MFHFGSVDMPVRHPRGDVNWIVSTEERDLRWKHKFGNCYHKGFSSQRTPSQEVERKEMREQTAPRHCKI